MERLAETVVAATQDYIRRCWKEVRPLIDSRLAAELGPLVQINEGLAKQLEEAKRRIAALEARR
jgi:hypothetical protein